MEKADKAMLTRNIFDVLDNSHDLVKGLRCFEIKCSKRKIDSEESFIILEKLIDEYLLKRKQ